MKLSDKIVRLRKSNGWSQEDLAEKLNVTRQTISRWEGATAQPDAMNILQLSKLFGVTADYLLYDEYESDDDLPRVKEANNDGIHQILILMITLEVMILMIQYMTIITLQNEFLGVLSFIPFVATIGGFEFVYRKKKSVSNETARGVRKTFYKASAWLGTYFPIRLLVTSLSSFYPRPYHTLTKEGIILALYLMSAIGICLWIEKNY